MATMPPVLFSTFPQMIDLRYARAYTHEASHGHRTDQEKRTTNLLTENIRRRPCAQPLAPHSPWSSAEPTVTPSRGALWAHVAEVEPRRPHELERAIRPRAHDVVGPGPRSNCVERTAVGYAVIPAEVEHARRDTRILNESVRRGAGTLCAPALVLYATYQLITSC